MTHFKAKARERFEEKYAGFLWSAQRGLDTELLADIDSLIDDLTTEVRRETREEVAEELVSVLPTGEVHAFDLIKTIGQFIAALRSARDTSPKT